MSLSKVSIITINLNNKNGLEKTLNSIFNQSYNDMEILIIDGGSNDGSLDIIKKYENQIEYWISEPDNGIYQAMNKGIEKAKGEYCFFLNSGDYMAKEDVIESVFIENPTEDILFGNLFITLNDKVDETFYGKPNLTFLDVYANTIKHQAAFIKKDLFMKFGYYNENLKIVSDWEFFLKTVGLGYSSYRYFNIFISYFDNDGISNHSMELAMKERLLVKNIYIPSLMQTDYDFLFQHKKYLGLFTNRIGFLLIRLVNKILSTLHCI